MPGRKSHCSLQLPREMYGWNSLGGEQTSSRAPGKFSASILTATLKERPLRIGLIGILIGTLAYGLIPFTPVELFPTADREELPIDISLPKGSDIEETNMVVREVQAWVAKQPGVRV